jgi:hypothetical protein
MQGPFKGKDNMKRICFFAPLFQPQRRLRWLDRMTGWPKAGAKRDKPSGQALRFEPAFS